MAPAITSHSFLLSPAPLSKLNPKNARPSATRISAKQSSPFPFKLGRRGGGDAEPSEDEDAKLPKRGLPFFDFGKVSDPKSLIPAMVNQPSTSLFFSNQRRKDPRTVFVAGATGQAGVRIAQALLRQDFAVRAGVPDLSDAQELARLAAKYKIISPEESKRLNAVEMAFDSEEAIAKAIGNATKVVVTIGPAENGAASEVTTTDALRVVQAARLAGVTHVAVVYDASGSLLGSTYNVLDGLSSFFTNLFAKVQPLTLAEFLKKVVEADVSYTLIKTKLTEDFSSEGSYGIVVSPEGSAAATNADDFKVSKSQIASVVADVFANTSIAENKVVEISTNPSAPSKSVEELFRAIPEDGRRKAYKESIAKAKAEEEAIKASERAREAANAAKKLEEEVKKLSEQEAEASKLAGEAKKKAEEAGSSLEAMLNKAKDLGGGFSWEKVRSQVSAAVGQKEEEEEEEKVAVATVRGQAKVRALTPRKVVVKKGKGEEEEEEEREVRKVFGGLFKQEVIYMDD
ncbi:hypothetical protein QJS10_CPB14g00670 [Acorus calamus]|uniref:NAD(P)-binding domain-containing protein n=1 Tax=Acorus calamus TaxID=4465 RepID=A0AAV9DAS2_ACOCL|nr:hypothetical protein QJS10_CPB14g00670 [Acorus calamus]